MFWILAVLGLVGAIFVIGEYAVVTARRAALTPRGGAGARAALRPMDDPVRVISTVQVRITAVGILTGVIGEPGETRGQALLAKVALQSQISGLRARAVAGQGAPAASQRAPRLLRKRWM